MLSQDYINQVQSQLTNYFKNNIDNSDDHHIQVYVTNSNSNDGYITYTPNWLDDHSDNDGQIMPTRKVIVHVLSKNGENWTTLVNQQFIHAQKFTENDYYLNFNYRKDNGIDNNKKELLAHDLKTKFNLKLSQTGLLIEKVNKKFLPAFVNMIKAIQYLYANGLKYTSKDDDSSFNVGKELEIERDVIKDADTKYRNEKRKHAGKRTRKPKRRKAFGKIVQAYSSTSGTPREKYERERAQKAKKRAKEAKKTKSNKHSKSHKKSIKGLKFATCGRFSSSTGAIKKLIKTHGGKIQAYVNSQTDYLVCNKPSKSKKFTLAKQLKVNIITENVLKNML